VRHAEEVGGDGVNLDLCYLNQLNGSALLPLASLEQRLDLPPMFRQRVILVRQQVQKRVAGWQSEQNSWRWRDAQRLTELSRYQLAKLSIPKGYYVACNGELLRIGDRSWEEASDERY
jgi:hypothetical protein